MEYPKEFIAKVRAEYPDWEELHKMLEQGNSFVGRCLDDSRYFKMGPVAIIEAFEKGREKDVLEAAKKTERRIELYVEWGKLYDEQILSKR